VLLGLLLLLSLPLLPFPSTFWSNYQVNWLESISVTLLKGGALLSMKLLCRSRVLRKQHQRNCLVQVESRRASISQHESMPRSSPRGLYDEAFTTLQHPPKTHRRDMKRSLIFASLFHGLSHNYFFSCLPLLSVPELAKSTLNQVNHRLEVFPVMKASHIDLEGKEKEASFFFFRRWTLFSNYPKPLPTLIFETTAYLNYHRRCRTDIQTRALLYYFSFYLQVSIFVDDFSFLPLSILLYTAYIYTQLLCSVTSSCSIVVTTCGLIPFSYLLYVCSVCLILLVLHFACMCCVYQQSLRAGRD